MNVVRSAVGTGKKVATTNIDIYIYMCVCSSGLPLPRGAILRHIDELPN